MRIPFEPLPRAADRTPRPIVHVMIDDFDVTTLPCLVDTGSLHNRFAGWIAREAGIDLDHAKAEEIGIGGLTLVARTIKVRLAIARFSWEAPVSFCEPWPWDFNVLGQEGFMRRFVVTLRTAERMLELRATKA